MAHSKSIKGGGRSERRVIQKVVPLRAAAATAATLDTVGRRELEENIEKNRVGKELEKQQQKKRRQKRKGA